MTTRLLQPKYLQPQTWPLRWLYAAGGFLLGVAYSLTALLLGVESTFRGVDVTLWVGGVVEASFAVFGYLLGLNAEARRRERHDAEVIETQLRDLASLRARLDRSERLASLGELAGAVVHEVRNPLAIIRSMAQNLEESLEDAEREAATDPVEISRQIRDEVDRLARVTSSLSAFSRRPTLRPQPVDAERLASRVRLLASELLETRDIELVLVPPSQSTPQVLADEDLVTQVLLGLVENAAAETPSAGIVRLGWRDAGGALELTVTDQGPGVPEELRERIFDPFFTTRAQGHGLGLAVARQIVRAHCGEIDVVNAAGDGRGAEFRVRLPLDAAEEIEMPEEIAAA